MQQDNDYFIKVPNQYIQHNIQDTFKINKKFLIIYISISRYRSKEGFSWIVPRHILDFYGYKCTNKKPKAFQEIIDILRFMVDLKMIETDYDLSNVTYDSFIIVKIIPENFDSKNKFTILSMHHLDTILKADTFKNKENLLRIFLFITSFIGRRSTQSLSSQVPAACWYSIEKMSKLLSISKKSILQCITYLTSSHDAQPALLIQYDPSFVWGHTMQKTSIPKIYVLNQDGYQEEIESAMQAIQEIYRKSRKKDNSLENI